MISIHSQRGIIGIESKRGHFEIETKKPDLHVHSAPTRITANNRPGVLRIDYTQTENAVTGGKAEEYWQRIYSQYKEVARQNLEKIVMEGNRMADLTMSGNPIADMALDAFIEGAPDLQVFGPASVTNTKISYTPNDMNIEVELGETQINVETYRPEIHFERGYVRTYMEQWPSVTVTPPRLDLMG